MRGGLYCLMASITILGACSGVHKEPRPLFDSRTGVAGGNEFNARSQDGPDGKFAESADTPQPSRNAAGAAPQPAAVVAPAVPAAPAPAGVLIDAHAYGAVFGTTPAPVKPTAAQLMQLDSLSLMVADPVRVVLQNRILECRRAGENCRIGSP
jgi:hypothetical protein